MHVKRRAHIVSFRPAAAPNDLVPGLLVQTGCQSGAISQAELRASCRSAVHNDSQGAANGVSRLRPQSSHSQSFQPAGPFLAHRTEDD